MGQKLSDYYQIDDDNGIKIGGRWWSAEYHKDLQDRYAEGESRKSICKSLERYATTYRTCCDDDEQCSIPKGYLKFERRLYICLLILFIIVMFVLYNYS